MEKTRFLIRIEREIIDAAQDASMGYQDIKHPEYGSAAAYLRDSALRCLKEDGVDMTKKYPLLRKK